MPYRSINACSACNDQLSAGGAWAAADAVVRSRAMERRKNRERGRAMHRALSGNVPRNKVPKIRCFQGIRAWPIVLRAVQVTVR